MHHIHRLRAAKSHRSVIMVEYLEHNARFRFRRDIYMLRDETRYVRRSKKTGKLSDALAARRRFL
jgi:hypothetical protein